MGLEGSFLEEEVFSALFDLNEDKVVGPKGFTMTFWQFTWDFVKNEVMGSFSDFFANCKFGRSLNSTFCFLL